MNLQTQPHNEGSGILGMGIIGALLPLTLFSGESGTADLITHAAEIEV